ncbi:MAG: copper chaperone PCu(A)C [Burkholderiales bacterium]
MALRLRRARRGGTIRSLVSLMIPMHILQRFATLIALCLFTSFASAADIKVENAWARATAPGQKTGSAYVELTSPADAALVAAGSPLAARVELHSMTLEGGVMRMRALPRIDLPAGKTVKLAPNGLHLMLIDLKRPLKAGDKLPLVLSVQTSGTSLTTLNIEAEVRAVGDVHKH